MTNLIVGRWVGVEIKEVESEYLVLKKPNMKESDRMLCVQQRYGSNLYAYVHIGEPRALRNNTSFADLDIETDKRGLSQGHRPSPISIFIVHPRR